MRMEYGLFDRMVLQRTRRGVCEAALGGSCAADGNVVACVTKGGKVVAGFANRKIGAAADGRFEGKLAGLKTGGPYDIELSIAGASGKAGKKLRVKSVLVGDVWILAGQSNMEGIGLIKDAAKPHLMTRALYLNDRWDTAKDPINNLVLAIDRVHWGANGQPRTRGKVVGTAPGVAFGQAMHKRTGVPQGLIPCAHGGTSMAEWDPARKSEGGNSLYGAMVRRFNTHGGRVAGVLWYQGESDATPEASAIYTDCMKSFVAAVRDDLGDPKLPLVLVQIGRVLGSDKARAGYWNSVQDQQRRLPDVIPHCSVVPAIDLPLDDRIHISGAGQNRLGRRLAYAMAVLKEGRKAGLPPIQLKRVAAVQNRYTGLVNIEVHFDNVVGQLRAGTLPTGFAFTDPNGNTILPFDIELEGNRAILRTGFNLEDVDDKRIYYGLGTETYCNITDEADRSLPVFSPPKISTDRAATPFVRETRISPMLPSTDKLEGVTYPQNLDSLNLARRSFQSYFMNRHLEYEKSTEERVAYYACAFECDEPMQLVMLFGYDGPIRAWLDGREVFYDPNGTNPSVADSAKVKFNATPGKHEALFALGSNKGLAWGMFLRFERLDVSKELLHKGPDHYRLPRILG